MGNVRRTPLAEQDLEEIWLFVAQDDPAAADRLLDVLGNTMVLLADNPLMGRARPDIAPELRYHPAGNHLLQFERHSAHESRIPKTEEEFSMTTALAARAATGRLHPGSVRQFGEFRSAVDQLVLEVFHSRQLQRALQGPGNVNLALLWKQTAGILQSLRRRPGKGARELRDVHHVLVDGLPGDALFIAAAMAFDSLKEALPLFDLTAKTARARIGDRLPSSEGEIALRIGRVLAMADEVFGSLEVARNWLRTPNFALGGAVPRDLLKTAEGETLAVAELQVQAAGGPV